MPKNKIGGSKHKKAKNYIESNSIRYKENHENYGKVVKILEIVDLWYYVMMV